MQNNPERFIQSAVEDNISWSEYVSNMSLEATWGDHIIMQAIAEAMNLRIHHHHHHQSGLSRAARLAVQFSLFSMQAASSAVSAAPAPPFKVSRSVDAGRPGRR